MTPRRRLLAVLGTRPEVIKLAPVLRAFRKRPGIRVRLCVTAQHRGLLDQAMRVFGLRGDHDLGLMRPGQDPGALAARLLKAVRPVLEAERPDLLMVQGDTTTAAAAAWAASCRKIPVAHVEAGLRSFDPENPFPEENNRILIDRLSVLHFAPTRGAAANLRREGIRGKGVSVTGNTVVDALRWALQRPGEAGDPRLRRFLRDGPVILTTLHRRESFGRPLREVFRGLRGLLGAHPDARIVFPAHPNPRVRDAARRALKHPRILLPRAMPYLRFVRLLAACRFVITDSGGLQEEAAALRKPVLVARDATERPELLESGVGVLVGRDPRKIIQEAGRLLTDEKLYRKMCARRSPFGDGHAGERIADAIGRWLA